MAVMITIHDILKPIAEWYGGGTEGNRSDLDIIIDVVSDLQKDRARVLVQAKRIKEFEAELIEVKRARNIEQGAWEEVKKYQDENKWLRERIKELEAGVLQVVKDSNDIQIEASAKIRELEAELEQHRWIPVSERLPELPSGPPNASSESVWLIFKDKPQMGYYTNYDGWRVYGIRFQKRLNQTDITHWKPIILPK